MSENMVERVAKAVCEAADEDWDAESYLDTASGNEPEDQRDYWRVIARAAIEAMQEPVKDIVLAAEPYAGAYVHDICRSIDVALSEHQP